MIFIQVGLFLRGSNDFFIGLTLSITNFFHSVFNPYSLIFILSFEDKSPISLFIIFLMIFFYGSPFLLSFIFSIVFRILLGSMCIFIGKYLL